MSRGHHAPLKVLWFIFVGATIGFSVGSLAKESLLEPCIEQLRCLRRGDVEPQACEALFSACDEVDATT